MILWRPCQHRQVSVFQQLASQLLPEDGKVEAWIPGIAEIRSGSVAEIGCMIG